MLRVSLNSSWNQHPLRNIRLRFAGHYFASKKELAGHLIFWLASHGMRTHGKLCKTFVDQLVEDVDYEVENRQTMDHRETFKEKVMACRFRSTRQGKKVITNKITRKTYHYIIFFKL